MPSYGADAAATVPPPPAPTGLTPSAPLNVGIGAATVGGTNALTASVTGPDVVGLAFGVTMLFEHVKLHPRFNQHRWAYLVLLVLGLTAALLVAAVGSHDYAAAIPKGMAAAWQAMANYVGQKAAGLPGLPPSTIFPGSEPQPATGGT